MPNSFQHTYALSSISAWLRCGEPQVFRLFGYAGTGKTTLAKQIANGLNGEVIFAAYTGKAASVMRARGCAGADTLHSLLYRPVEEIDAEGRLQTRFVLNRHGPVANADLIIVDECSMVDERLGRDLLSFGKPVLALGDPFQLPPIDGTGFFVTRKPDIMLDQIHRQAADSPIVQLATQVREGKRLKLGTYGNSSIVGPDDLDLHALIRADQVLVGTNAMRRRIGQRLRAIRGQSDDAPIVGDRLVCLRNDRKKHLFNGTLFTVEEVRPAKQERVDRLYVIADDELRDGQPRRLAIKVNRAFFEGTEDKLGFEDRRRSDHFTYADALTVHKAQGSQWGEVVIFDESETFRDHSRQWLYSSLTRAAERVMLVTRSMA